MTQSDPIMSGPNFDVDFRPIKDGSEIIAPQLRALYAFWQERRGSDPFAPADLQYLLEFPLPAAHWSIADVCDGGSDFVYRFAGQGIVDVIGIDPTGHRHSELVSAYGSNQFGANTTSIYKLVLKTGLPVLNGPKQIALDNKSFLRIQSLNLPLGQSGPLPQWILSATELLPELQ